MTVAWVIGAGGMLGAALRRRLAATQTSLFVPQTRFEWGDEALASRQLEAATRAFAKLVSPGQSWEIYWAAGLGTMASSAGSMAAETRLVEKLLAVTVQQSTLMQSSGTLALASTAGGIYAGSAADIISEATATSPTTDYARAKLDQELIVADYVARHPGARAVIGRLSTLYGLQPNVDKRQGLIAEMARRVILNQPIHIFVPLDTIRDYLEVDDAADALVGLARGGIEQSPMRMKIIASEQPTTISEITATFKKLAHRMPKIIASTSSLAKLYRRRIQFRSNVLPFAEAWRNTSLTLGIARLLASERAAFARTGRF